MTMCFTEKHEQHICGGISCWDRVVITGTLPQACYADGMTNILYAMKVRIFDYPAFAKPLAEEIKTNASRLADAAGVKVEYLARKQIRKEDRVRAVLKSRGEHPGLVHILSTLEPCASYKPWHDKQTGQTYLKPTSGLCLHYYFYFIDVEFGLCYLRVPTYSPFRLQFYFNGHNWLAGQLAKRGIKATLVDNVLVACDDWGKAQQIVDGLNIEKLHRCLDRFARLYCPAARVFRHPYHWSLMQAEYAHDIVFTSKEALAPVYESMTRTAVQAVKVDQIATFLSRKIAGNYQGEVGGRYHTRIEGTCIKHSMGRAASIKMYDKLGKVLRIETTVNDVSFFKHHRKVEHRDGTSSVELASLRKNIYSLPVLKTFMAAANSRYLAFIGQLPDESPGLRAVQKLAEKVRDRQQDRAVRGFNLLWHQDHELFLALSRGEFTIGGITNARLRKVLVGRTTGQMGRTLRALRMHGLIKKVGKTYKHYLTQWGRRVIAGALQLREFTLIPAMAKAA